jgi:hypothetical protein
MSHKNWIPLAALALYLTGYAQTQINPPNSAPSVQPAPAGTAAGAGGAPVPSYNVPTRDSTIGLRPGSVLTAAGTGGFPAEGETRRRARRAQAGNPGAGVTRQ